LISQHEFRSSQIVNVTSDPGHSHRLLLLHGVDELGEGSTLRELHVFEIDFDQQVEDALVIDLAHGVVVSLHDHGWLAFLSLKIGLKFQILAGVMPKNRFSTRKGKPVNEGVVAQFLFVHQLDGDWLLEHRDESAIAVLLCLGKSVWTDEDLARRQWLPSGGISLRC